MLRLAVPFGENVDINFITLSKPCLRRKPSQCCFHETLSRRHSQSFWNRYFRNRKKNAGRGLGEFTKQKVEKLRRNLQRRRIVTGQRSDVRLIETKALVGVMRKLAAKYFPHGDMDKAFPQYFPTFRILKNIKTISFAIWYQFTSRLYSWRRQIWSNKIYDFFDHKQELLSLHHEIRTTYMSALLIRILW